MCNCAHWKTVNQLLGRQSHYASYVADNSPDQFQDFFHGKVDAVQKETSGVIDPSITVYHGDFLSTFQAVTVEDAAALVSCLLCKHCSLDPVPTWLIKEVNFFSTIHYFACQKSLVRVMCHYHRKLLLLLHVSRRLILIQMQRAAIDQFQTSRSYSKVIEHTVYNLSMPYLNAANLFRLRQSAYRAGFSMGTAEV
jgi:hypothetical protein